MTLDCRAMSASKVVVVGSFVVGLTLRAERFPTPGETILARDFDMGPGGKGSNQAVQIARAGCDVQFVGVVGTDDFAQIAVDLYAAEGVGTDHLARTSERNTGVGFIILDESGDNRILLDPGTNDTFTGSHIEDAAAAFTGASVVVAQLEIPAQTARAGLAAGKEAACTTILNPAPARPVPLDMFEVVDILTPNQTEARILLGLQPDDPYDDLALCDRLRTLGVGTVVLTRGERGAVIVDTNGVTKVDPYPIEVTDTTGAGDAFNGTLAAALASGIELEEAARRAAAAGALACTKLGVIPALPTAQEVDRLMGAA